MNKRKTNDKDLGEKIKDFELFGDCYDLKKLELLAEVAAKSPREPSDESPTKKTKVDESRITPIKLAKPLSKDTRRILFPENAKKQIITSIQLVALTEEGDLSVNIFLPARHGLHSAFSINQIKFMTVDLPKGGKSRSMFDATFHALRSGYSKSGEFVVEGHACLGRALGMLVREWTRNRRTNVMASVVISQSTTDGYSIQETIARCVCFDKLEGA